jgi:hypothetical protein
MNIDDGKLVLLAQSISTLFMAGVIWFVQVVHYPLLARVGSEGFTEYEAAHIRRTTWIVGPPMLLEALTAGLLVWRPPVGVSPVLCGIGVCLLFFIWASTAFIHVPRHTTLGSSFDADAHRSLVRSNWIRTVAWSIRSFVVVFMIGKNIAGGPTGA